MPIIIGGGRRIVQLVPTPTVEIGVVSVKNAAGAIINPATEDTLKAQPSFAHRRIAVGTTPTQLTATATPAKKGVLVKALAANTAPVYVGGPTVSITNGYELSPTEEVFIPVDDASKIYVVAASAQQVCWLVV
jgi:hypothetical protein